METYGRLTGEQPRPENYQVGPFPSDKTSDVVVTSMEDFWSMGGRLECKVVVTSMEDFWSMGGRLECKVGNPFKREADPQNE
ncbi:hypothetical protein HYV88_04690 [Candidatus Woesearchaeota archaeon]|nr:hypothetical protein [Candidatus Woesearchaeota archaeon]